MHRNYAVKHNVVGDDHLVVLTCAIAGRCAAEREGRDVCRSQVKAIDTLLARHLRLARLTGLRFGRVFDEDWMG